MVKPLQPFEPATGQNLFWNVAGANGCFYLSLMNLTLPAVVLLTLSSTIFGAGGFYLLTSWRLKKLEDTSEAINEFRERLVRIETNIEYLKNRA